MTTSLCLFEVAHVLFTYKNQTYELDTHAHKQNQSSCIVETSLHHCLSPVALALVSSPSAPDGTCAR